MTKADKRRPSTNRSPLYTQYILCHTLCHTCIANIRSIEQHIGLSGQIKLSNVYFETGNRTIEVTITIESGNALNILITRLVKKFFHVLK